MARITGIEMELHPLNLGGNVFGWTADREQSFEVLDAFVAAGGNFIDTADGYSHWVPGNHGGESETILGEWLAARGRREHLVLATKVSTHPQRKGLARQNILGAADDSLGRLRTDHIDLYYAHFDEEGRPIEEIAGAFDELVRSGRVGAVGVSNFSAERIRAWLDHAESEGLARPVALQPHYNLVERRRFEQEYLPLAREHGLAVCSYYSLASGFLTGKYRTTEDLTGATRGASAANYLNEQGLGVVDALVEVAEEHGCEPTTVALAWLLAKTVTAPIASARTPRQLEALMALDRVQLSDEQVARLDGASSSFA
ncbi:aldo/keto reductase [Luteococcus sp. OSA5]|uniref:aldo/keto reductase n=1 Tax=Luteococcus sp. OSA5 TaxID=3401630 RepID=UPI003B438D03